MAAHAGPLVLALYLGTSLCVALTGVAVWRLSRHLARLEQGQRDHIHLMKEIATEMNAIRRAIGLLRTSGQTDNGSVAKAGASGRIGAAVREELKSLIAELQSD